MKKRIVFLIITTILSLLSFLTFFIVLALPTFHLNFLIFIFLIFIISLMPFYVSIVYNRKEKQKEFLNKYIGFNKIKKDNLNIVLYDNNRNMVIVSLLAEKLILIFKESDISINYEDILEFNKVIRHGNIFIDIYLKNNKEILLEYLRTEISYKYDLNLQIILDSINKKIKSS